MRTSDNRRFGKGGAYTCRGCGKRTRETGHDESSVELCRDCMEEAEAENFCSDNCSGDVHVEGCIFGDEQ